MPPVTGSPSSRDAARSRRPGRPVRGSPDPDPPAHRGLAALWIPVMVTAALTAALAFPVGFLLLPLPADAQGMTLCLPGIGPLQRVDPELDPDLAEVVWVHEGVHAEQCRRLGAFRYAATVLHLRGKLELEAEAWCSEVRLLARRGADPVPLVREAVSAVYEGYGNDGRVRRIEVRRMVLRACTDPALDRPFRDRMILAGR